MQLPRRQYLGAVGAVVAGSGFAGCQGQSEDDEGHPLLTDEPNYRGWFDGVSNYRGTRDYRSESTVVVRVGVAGDVGYYKFGPPAVAVSPGTEVVWRWTGKGGAHNVVAERGAYDSGDPVAGENQTFTFRFEEPAVYTYLCEPHHDIGMRGAVFVALG
ncbi:MAG: halocyanin domain-containing protein [Halobacteriaceae archaeon]